MQSIRKVSRKEAISEIDLQNCVPTLPVVQAAIRNKFDHWDHTYARLLPDESDQADAEQLSDFNYAENEHLDNPEDVYLSADNGPVIASNIDQNICESLENEEENKESVWTEMRKEAGKLFSNINYILKNTKDAKQTLEQFRQLNEQLSPLTQNSSQFTKTSNSKALKAVRQVRYSCKKTSSQNRKRPSPSNNSRNLKKLKK